MGNRQSASGLTAQAAGAKVQAFPTRAHLSTTSGLNSRPASVDRYS